MSAYVVVQEDIKDEAAFDSYRKQVVPMITAHGGRFIVRGGKFTVLEGEWPMPRLVIIEVPSRPAAETWDRAGAEEGGGGRGWWERGGGGSFFRPGPPPPAPRPSPPLRGGPLPLPLRGR